MIETSLRTLTIKLAISGIPDCSGIRIRSIDPTGLYISSQDREAAQWYFETLIIELVCARKLLVVEPGEGVMLSEQYTDWNNFLIQGEGEVIVRTISTQEVTVLKKEGTPIVIPPVQKLHIDWWKDPSGNPFCLVRDPGDAIDSWLIDTVKEDLEKAPTI